MQANIIKDVIDKIISINKDLNEESLVNLLIASGWDKGDVELGKDFFYRSQANPNALPAVIDKTNNNVLVINTTANSIPVIHNLYEHALENLDTNRLHTNNLDIKSVDIKIDLEDNKEGIKNKILYIWLNIGILITLLIILASYIMSFNWR